MRIKIELLKCAMDALESTGIVTNGTYPKEFNGYVSSLGAAIIQSGLLPAILFYEGDSEQAPERRKLIKSILIILKEHFKHSEPLLLQQSERTLSFFLLDKIDNPSFQDSMLREITESATAIKLALRLYKKKTNE